MQQEELSTSQPCGQGHSLQETGDQTDESLKAPGSWDTHKYHTWERSLTGRVFTGQSLPSSAKHRDSIPAAQADNSAQTKLHQRPLTGARVGDGLSRLLLQAEKCCSVQGCFQPLAENQGLLETKAPDFHPRTYRAALGGGGSKNLHLFISLLPSPFLLPHPPRLQGGRKSCIKCLERISS